MVCVYAVATNVAANYVYDQLDDQATSSPYAKDLGNLLYHSAVVGGLSVGYNMVGKKLLKKKKAD